MSSPLLIVGLGNPGAQYVDTRHNAGFRFVQDLAASWALGNFSHAQRLQADTVRGRVARCGDADVLLALPQTFMNRSGAAVRAICDYYHIPPQDVIVVHDDSDFDTGQWVMQTGRGAAGHNGVADIIEKLGTQDFSRIRIGIRPVLPPEADRPKASTFVLVPFSAPESAAMKHTLPQIRAALEKAIMRD